MKTQKHNLFSSPRACVCGACGNIWQGKGKWQTACYPENYGKPLKKLDSEIICSIF